MSTQKKKIRKLRGHVSHGKGRIGKHRKHPGGRGKAGGLTHHRINIEKYHPNYFGKRGQRHFNAGARHWVKDKIDFGGLWKIVGTQNFTKPRKDGTAAVIDLNKAGYGELLMGGPLPTAPLIVKVDKFTADVEEKVRSAGGMIICTSKSS